MVTNHNVFSFACRDREKLCHGMLSLSDLATRPGEQTSVNLPTVCYMHPSSYAHGARRACSNCSWSCAASADAIPVTWLVPVIMHTPPN
jgi:hypothetical protein